MEGLQKELEDVLKEKGVIGGDYSWDQADPLGKAGCCLLDLVYYAKTGYGSHMDTTKKRILFLCTHNSCRSQMAEGLINHYLGDRFTAFSAGTEATRVHPLAAQVLAELGIDTSGQHSKTLEEFSGQQFDHVITLCGSANEQCPLFFGGTERVHIGFDDPSRLSGSTEEVLPEFRRVRDEILERLTWYLGGKQ